MNKAYTLEAYKAYKHLFTRQSVDSGTFTRKPCKNIYSPGRDKLTEVQLYMSTSGQPGSRVIRAFSDVEKPCFFFLFGG